MADLLENKMQFSQYVIMEHFYTLQGEGYWTGIPAYFVRLAGCDVGCHWCDVKESWDDSKFPHYTVEKIIQNIQNTPALRVVITGGEPLQQNMDALCLALKAHQYKIHLETSGAYSLSGRWDWICLSPKKFKQPLETIYPFVNELKIIIFNPSDFEFAEHHAQLCPENTILYLQPEWSRKDKMLPLIIDYVKRNPQWRVSLQTHKYMDIL